jgi:uncharacterized protein involved in outer membrane biogenesis
MRLSKWSWLLLAVLLVAGGIVAYAAINLNSFLAANRDMIAQRTARAIGRPVRFDRLELSVGRGLGIAVHELAIGDDPRFGSGDLLTAHRGFVQVRILPALFGRYEVARVSLESPTISVVETAQGTNVGSSSVGKENSEDAATAQSRAIAIALLDIDDGTVRYVDRTSRPAREILATHVAFHASDLSFGDALRFEFSAAVLGAAEPNLSASGAVGPVDLGDVGATPLDVVVQLENVDGKALRTALPALSDLLIDGPTTANLAVGGTVSSWTLNFAINPTRARVAYGAVFEKPRDSELTISGRLERRGDDEVVADGVEIATSSSTLTINGAVRPLSPKVGYTIALGGTGVSVGDWVSAFPALRDAGIQGHTDIALEITKAATASSPTINGRIGMDSIEARIANGPTAVSHLSGVLTFKGHSVTLAPTDLRIGGAPARLGAHIEDVFAPKISFEVSAPSLPLSALMEDATEDTIEGLDASGRLSLTEKAPALDAEVRAAKALIYGLPLANVRATVVGRGDSLRIDPLSFDTCGGSIHGALNRATSAGSPQVPQIAVDLNVVRLSLTDLATALVGARGGAPASGTLSLELVAAGVGKNWTSVQQALDGSGRFDIADGAIFGVNVPEAALERITGLPGLSTLLPQRLRADFPALFGQKDTRFDSLGASFRIARGRLETKDLAVKSRDFAIDADGAVGLDLGVDLSATLTTSQMLSDRLVGEVAAARLLANREGRISVPFRLVGELSGLKIEPDVPALTDRLRRGLLDTFSEKLLGGPKQKQNTSPP